VLIKRLQGIQTLLTPNCRAVKSRVITLPGINNRAKYYILEDEEYVTQIVQMGHSHAAVDSPGFGLRQRLAAGAGSGHPGAQTNCNFCSTGSSRRE
jgi:hypothetical protein